MIDKIKYLKDGDEWEKWMDKCYRLRYQHEGYQNVPASYRGDAGIEGYTKTGIVYQCYCPEKEYSEEELYKHQRKKVTNDINKLIENEDKLISLGINNKIKEWHFVTPEYRDKRLLQHCKNKREEVIEKKKKLGLKHIDDDFEIIIKQAEDFLKEITQLVFLNSDKFDITIKDFEIPDWNNCPSDKLHNIKNKLKKIINPEVNLQKYEQLVKIMVEYYIKGIEIKNNIKSTIPELYEMIFSIDNSYKSDLAIECLIMSDSSLNESIFKQTLDNLQKDLELNMGNILDKKSITELKYNLVSSWIADCPMDFA
ncbi:hypothetical protein [Paraclostridium sordellii]|uniref:hypothetical protein n=1 Tax=Paraclostridium sordellii TaxID=1505 RepID=UPI0005E6818D|nr:hypothetical protein [Paeniclostridium sordellii]CEQ14267.1 Uncharacterised protein [[Clostridium] sordellii] [Paeniclostridium sordellii]CEQ19395.1 Uncharacterised protein [[Clostridium] sordellii] [Paeniclostridium sordellii]CEQ28792.1 Uncharacterised protein [[Clostridium] sordellii] [Paeniclostridium sordellii]